VGSPVSRRTVGRSIALPEQPVGGGHAALYALMIFMPVTGYMFSAAGGYSLPWFGLFQWPRLLPHQDNIVSWGERLHDGSAWVISGVILLHLAAVAFHQWVKRDEVLSRMTGG
jgi:cytochrome b561